VRAGDAEVSGVAIPEGDVVTCLLGAADRDPVRWTGPEVLDVARPARIHFGFGFGLHRCLGISLARLEAAVWLDRLLDRIPDWDVAGDIEYGINFVLRGPVAVPLVLH
jgi:cytochrome P450